MKHKLKERLGRLGPTQELERVHSGSAVVVVVRPNADAPSLRVIDAVHALAGRGLSMLRAKRTIEAAIERGEAIVEVPTVENIANLAAELGAAGFRVSVKETEPFVDVTILRTNLGMTQHEFALSYGVELRTLQGWERNKRRDRTANSYLRAISADPKGMARRLERDIEPEHRS